jgi:hypothetical protein
MESLVRMELADDRVHVWTLFVSLVCLLAVGASIADGHAQTMLPMLAWCAVIGAVVGGWLAEYCFPFAQAFRGCQRRRRELDSDSDRKETCYLIAIGALVGAFLLTAFAGVSGALVHFIRGFGSFA